MLLLLVVLLLLLQTNVANAFTCDSPELADALYCNTSLPIGARVEALVGQLTMEEKTAHVLESGGSVPRLGIPELGSTECLRGYLSMFPQALTMSQAWNSSLVHAVASATGDEVRASANEGTNGGSLSSGNAGGSLACFDPVLNVCRDPRWGRCQEGYGTLSCYTTPKVAAIMNASESRNYSRASAAAAAAAPLWWQLSSARRLW